MSKRGIIASEYGWAWSAVLPSDSEISKVEGSWWFKHSCGGGVRLIVLSRR